MELCLCPGYYEQVHVFTCIYMYCGKLKTVNTRIISGKLCSEKKANQMQDEKMQAVMVISFVACGFFLWFDLICHRTIQMSKSNPSVHDFGFAY